MIHSANKRKENEQKERIAKEMAVFKSVCDILFYLECSREQLPFLTPLAQLDGR